MKCSLKMTDNMLFYDGLYYHSINFVTPYSQIIYYHDADGGDGLTFVFDLKEKHNYSRLIKFLKTYPNYAEMGHWGRAE